MAIRRKRTWQCVYRTNGERIPQLVMTCSPEFNQKYAQLVNAKVELPCADAIRQMPKLLLTEWIERLAFQRLQSKAELRTILM